MREGDKSDTSSGFPDVYGARFLHPFLLELMNDKRRIGGTIDKCGKIGTSLGPCIA